MDLWVLILGLVMLAVALPVAGRRVFFLFRLITSGQPAPDRVENVTRRLGEAARSQVVEVFAQRKLLRWSVPGAAHFFVFWAFLILGSVYLEAFGVLFSRNEDWAIPVIGHWDLLGFAQDFIAVMCLVGLATFAGIRLRNNPHKLGRSSRFSGSHLGGAWVILGMIVNVIWTMFLFRGASAAGEEPAEHLPYGGGAFVSQAIGKLFDGLSPGGLKTLEGVGLLLHIGVMLAFLVIVLNSKHLHIFVAPLNVLFKRQPDALGAVKPLTVAGKPIGLDDLDDLDEDSMLGVGSIEDFTWKGLLDMATCTECGRCQSQCPAWNTEKPLSPKMLIMNLRDHAFAKAPYTLASEADRANLPADVLAEAARPLVGETEGLAWEPEGGAIIDTDVLWSCVTCGACVNQCPVDIEHVDHIIDMRRYQVLVEANFPAELNQLFKGMENKGNPWNMSSSARLDWAKDLPFDVKVVGADAPNGIESLDEVEWLFWVGCAGAYEDRQKKTTRAVAELLDMAGVSFAVLGNGETCSGDQARRAGNEFLFQQLATQNAETFKEFKVKKVVSTCAHCFNTLKNEYADFGVELEVTHHTQLLNRLVKEGKLTPVATGDGAAKRSITYHDPCYIGRHNGVYSPPRELLQVLPGAELVEMERNSEKSFCCGAGGARMWMEENIGERINENRTNEAVGTGADQIAVGCPFCRVMLSDGLTAAQAKGTAREEVEVLDVAQMLLASVKGVPATRAKVAANGARETASKKTEETSAEPDSGSEPESGEATRTEESVTASEEVDTATKAGGSSLFDLGGDDEPDAKDSRPEPEPESKDASEDASEDAADSEPQAKEAREDEPEEKPDAKAEVKTEPAEDLGSGGSLFDLDGDDEPEAEPEAKAAEPEGGADDDQPEAKEPKPEVSKAETESDDQDEESKAGSEPKPVATAESTTDLGSGGSLFDIEADPTPEPAKTEPEAKEAEPEPQGADEPEAKDAEPEDDRDEPEPEPEPKPAATAGSATDSGSLFDIAAPEVIDTPAAKQPEPEEAAQESEEDPEPEPTDSGSGSLFDIAAPEVIDTPATKEPEPEDAAQEPEPERESQPEDTDQTPEPEDPDHEPAKADEPSAGSALSAAATFAATADEAADEAEGSADKAEGSADEAEGTADKAEGTDEAEDEAEDEADDEPEPEAGEKPQPASSGEAHEPKTDVDISDSGSLFDL